MFLLIVFGMEILQNLLRRYDFRMEKTARNSNIELLRIILMFMVILLHFNNSEMGGAFNYVENKPLNSFMLYFLESLSICAVNCFMIISGYFLAYNKSVKFSKILDLLFIVVLYKLFDFALSIILGLKSFSIKSFVACFIPSNYFAIFYIITYIFSPFIIIVFDNISKKLQNILLILLLLIFVCLPTCIDIIGNIGVNLNSISPISTNGNGAGYTVVQFLIMLVVGMYLRRNEIKGNPFVLLSIYIISSLIMTIFIKHFSSLYNYCSMFTVINAVCIFLLFNRLHFSSKIINFISKSVFSIYCLHVGFTMNELWKNYCIKPEFVGGGILEELLCVVISVSLMFIICLVIDIIMRSSIIHCKNKIFTKLPNLFSIEGNN